MIKAYKYFPKYLKVFDIILIYRHFNVYLMMQLYIAYSGNLYAIVRPETRIKIKLDEHPVH